MEHKEHRKVQAGIRNKEGVSGSKGEDKAVLKGWAGSRSMSCHQDGTSRKARSKTWDGVGTRIFLGDGRRKRSSSLSER